MKIRVATLREVLGILKPAVPRKPTLTILNNVLVKDGQLMATDMESMVILNVPEADDTFLLPYNDVLKMLQYVPGHDYLQMSTKRGKLMLAWTEGNATFPSNAVDEYPAIPEFEVKVEATIDGDTFVPALNSALPYTAHSTDRPILNGVTIVLGEPIEVAAGDSFRLAHIVLPLKFPEEHIIVVPAGAVFTIMHVWNKTPRTPPQGESLVPIVMAKRQVQIALDNNRGMRIVLGPKASVIVKLVQGNPPAWLKLIPKVEPVLKVQLFAREFETAVRRVSNVAHQGSGVVRLNFADDGAIVSAKADVNEISANIAVLDAQGTPNRVGLYVEHLSNYLKDKDGILTITWTGESAPVVFQHGKSPKVLIMPMTVEWGDKHPKAEVKPEPEEKTEPEAGVVIKAEKTKETPSPETSKPKKKRGEKAKSK